MVVQSPPKHKLLAMIDEFPALGKLEILQQSLAFVAGYGFKCYLISQDINQLKGRETGYGPDETAKSLRTILCQHCSRSDREIGCERVIVPRDNHVIGCQRVFNN